MSSLRKYRAVSLYSGAGGMDVGFSEAGFDILWANDINKSACETYSANHKGIIRCGDLANYMSELDAYKGVDLVIGGPPCQGFSVAGKMDPTDLRSQQVFKFMDVVEKIQPKAFVMENVKALASLEKWSHVREELFNRADELGFKFTNLVLLIATDYGVPQKRERMFFIGIRNPNGFNEINGIEHYLEKYKSEPKKVGKIIMELGKAGNPSNSRICTAKITLATKPVMRKSPYAGMMFNGAGRPINPNGYANTLPASMGGNKTPFVDEAQIFHNKPAWVEQYHQKLLDGLLPKYGNAPSFLRRITVDEALKIQTFPDNYHFCGKQSSIFCQIGNAVPCKLAYAVGAATMDMLQDCYPDIEIEKGIRMPLLHSPDANLQSTA